MVGGGGGGGGGIFEPHELFSLTFPLYEFLKGIKNAYKYFLGFFGVFFFTFFV